MADSEEFEIVVKFCLWLRRVLSIKVISTDCKVSKIIVGTENVVIYSCIGFIISTVIILVSSLVQASFPINRK